MTPLQRYQQDLQRLDFVADAAQKNAVEHLQRLYDELAASHNRNNVFSRLLRRHHKPCRGLYFWGGVGRGKTYLMDTFFESLPFKKKCVCISIVLCVACIKKFAV